MRARITDYADGNAVPDADLPSGSPVDSIEAALGVIASRPTLPVPRWLGPLAVCCLVGFLPWIVYLALTLPRRARADHYDLAWIGFDCAMWLVLAALAWAALKRHPATGPVAAVAATMLGVDAWFDVVTAADRSQFAVSMILAVTAEIPLAIICAWVAIHAEQIRARAYRRLRSRWEIAIGLVREAAAERDERTAVSPPPAAPPQR
ncbi:MAG: hypothetical protein ABI429_07860 [Jatrophihabitantaceae bacterium]